MTAIPLKKTFGDSFRQASVVAIDLGEKIARLDDGTEVRFTHLVLATGSEGDYPARTESKYVWGEISFLGNVMCVYIGYFFVRRTVEELEAENGSVAADVRLFICKKITFKNSKTVPCARLSPPPPS